MGKQVQNYETPKEVGRKLDDLQELVPTYNEVRYGNENILKDKK